MPTMTADQSQIRAVGRLASSREVLTSERSTPVPGAGTHHDVATGDEAHPVWRLAVRRDPIQAIEACTFLESITTDVQREPGFRDAAAAARVQEVIVRPWDGECREPVAGE
jgi:hypothetical protein